MEASVEQREKETTPRVERCLVSIEVPRAILHPITIQNMTFEQKKKSLGKSHLNPHQMEASVEQRRKQHQVGVANISID